MSRPVPRVFKRADGWAVRLPQFGFGASSEVGPFGSRDAVGEWLRRRVDVPGTIAAHVERAPQPPLTGDDRWAVRG